MDGMFASWAYDFNSTFDTIKVISYDFIYITYFWANSGSAFDLIFGNWRYSD